MDKKQSYRAKDGMYRSLSISNAILEHLRSKEKHVTFNKNGDIVVGSLTNSSNSPASPFSVIDSDDEDCNLDGALRCQKSNSNYETISSVDGGRRNNSLLTLTRFRSQPHTNNFLPEPIRLDAQFYSLRNSQSNLPEFNKRPLTDTPIVSTVASPECKNQSSDDEDLFAEYKNVTQIPPKKKTPRSTPGSSPSLQNMKNISHLNLADLNISLPKFNTGKDVSTGAVSPKDIKEPVPRLASPKISEGILSNVTPNTISNQITRTKSSKNRVPTIKTSRSGTQISTAQSPRSLTQSPVNQDTLSKSNKVAANLDTKVMSQITENYLKNVPEELQDQFKKTPSFENLKNLLLLKPFPKAKKTYTLNIPGQTSSKISPDGKIASTDVGSKLVIVMVGLPARGKSYITNKLTRYLNWIQHDCRVFNVGNTRRMDKDNVLGPAHRPLPDTNTPLPFNGRSPEEKPVSPTSHSADFFNPENKASTDLREKWAMDTLDNLLDWVLNGSGSVGILDATNSTKKRRVKVLKRIRDRTNGELKVLFLESICADRAILDTNIRLKLSGPDYRDMDPEVALRDFLGRLRNYESAYETIDESEEALEGFQYVKMIDVGKKVVSFNIQGFLASQTIYFLLNFNLCERQIWLTRHGESVDNLSGRIGGDSSLTKRGRQFLKTLNRFLSYQRREFRKKQLEKFSTRLELRYNELTGTSGGESSTQEKNMEIPTEPSFCVWTSMLLRAIETGNAFSDQEYSVKAMRMLNELGGGKFEGMTYDEIKRKHPKEFESRIKSKLSYRYPGVGGESYLDVLVRLRPLINEIERTTDHLLIVSHRVVLRVLLAYFLNLDKSAIVDLDVPLHTLYCLELNPYGTDYKMFEYDEASDWFRSIEPEHQKNVKEVGVNYKERKYSVIPTAPPLLSKTKKEPRIETRHPKGAQDNFSIRASIIQGNEDAKLEEDRRMFLNASSSRKLTDLQKLRKP